jgi:PAS domain S-box-containing protein
MPGTVKQSHSADKKASASPQARGSQGHQEFLSCLLDYIPDRIYFKDPEGRFLLVSRAEAEFLGVKDPAGVIGKTDFDYFEPSLAQAAFDDEQEVMRTGRSITGKEERKQLLDGRTGWALVAKIPLRDSDGRIIGTCGISKDITKMKETESALNSANSTLVSQKIQLERSLVDLHKAHQELKTAQRQLIKFEKVQMLAHLAFGVAHEIRNPLGIVEMGIGYMAGRPAITQDEQLTATLHRMSEAVERVDLVIKALMDGARSSGVAVKPTEVAEIVRLAVDSLKGGSNVPDPAGSGQNWLG